MVIEKREETVKGEFYLGDEHKGFESGNVKYEFVTSSAITKGFNLEKPWGKSSETREGQFAVLKEGKGIAILSYSVRYSSNQLDSRQAQLSISEWKDPENYFNNKIIHHFEDGEYTHSEISFDSSLTDKIKLPPNLTLYPEPDYEEMLQLRIKTHENHIENTFEDLRKAESEFRKAENRVNKSLNVLVQDFKIPDEIREELKNANFPLIHDLIGDYLE